MSIAVQHLTKIYGEQTAVNNISFEIGKGEIVGFLGPNGAGKSTTMKMITGYLPPTEGSAFISGYNVQEQPIEARQRFGYLPEANPLYFDMYVREYLGFGANIHHLGNNKVARIEEMIERTGLGKESHKKIGMLSKGYKQRVGLAQAMLHDPEVLILDEPTSGLDPNQIVEIRDLIKTFGAEKTVLLSTHIMQEVQAMCSRVVIISSGTIVADDPIEVLQNVPQNNHLMVTFDKPVADVLWKQLKHAGKVNLVHHQTYRLQTSNPEALRKEIMQWAVAHDLVLQEMKVETRSLEDVFRTLTN